jgi:hypothetical protein
LQINDEKKKSIKKDNKKREREICGVDFQKQVGLSTPFNIGSIKLKEALLESDLLLDQLEILFS